MTPSDGRAYMIDMTQEGRSPVLSYFAITFAWTWPLWWSAAVFERFAGPLPFLAGGLGPLVGAAWLVSRSAPEYRRRFLRRLWDPRRISPSSWLALLGVALGPGLVGAGVALLAGATATVPDLTIGAVAAVVTFALAAGLAEEPGWRGAGLDAWQPGSHPLIAAAGISVFWALWHLPLYFIEGSYQHGLGFGSLRFWLNGLVLFELGVLYVWLTNGARGSILIVVLAHAGFNITGELVPRSALGDLVAFVVVSVATLVVVAVTRGRLGSLEPGRAVDQTDEEEKARPRWGSWV